MLPTICLDTSADGPELENAPEDLYPLIAMLIEQYSPLSGQDKKELLEFLALECLFLNRDSESVFQKLAEICERVVVGKLVQFNVERLKMSEYSRFMMRGAEDGVVTDSVKAAARRYLDFLAEHPDLWPLRERGMVKG